MSFREESTRIFVGGLSWNTTERQLEHAFSPYGKILETQVMLDRDTGRPRGFAFITFEDPRDMEDAIKNMDGREIDGRIVSVNQAQPKMGKLEPDYRHGGTSFPSGGRGNFGGGGGDRPITRTECFKCGRSGHWARECRSGAGGPIPHRPKFDSEGSGRGDHFGGDRYGDNIDDRYDNGRYGDRDRMDSRDRSNKFGGGSRYGGQESRYYDAHDRYPPEGAERFSADRYDSSDRYPQNGYGKDRSFDREGGARSNNARYGSSNDRYGASGPISGGGRGNYRVRPGPYDRPGRGSRPSYDDRF